MEHVRGSYAQTYVLNVPLVPIPVNLVVSVHPSPCFLSLGFFYFLKEHAPVQVVSIAGKD